MTNECAVCYVSDINFLLPSIISAAGVRTYVPAHKADILIFLIDEENRAQEINPLLKSYGIEVIPISSQAYKNFDMAKYHDTGMPLSTLGRFFIDDLLPPTCQRIVYIDGDTWIRRDPSALIDAIVPEGRFAAAEDMMSFRHNSFLPKANHLQAYFGGLGLTSKSGYFNAGVFATSRRTWRTLASDAFAFFANNVAACKFHDQSAVNAVIGDRRLRLSLKWNFQTPYRQLAIDGQIDPHLYHFTRFPKPWMVPCEPWKEIYPDYQTALKPFAGLNLPMKKLDRTETNNSKKLMRSVLLKAPFLSSLAATAMGIARYEKQAWV